MENENKTTTEESLEAKFRKIRREYLTEIQTNVELLYNIKNVKEAQVKFLSMRQRLLEDNHTLLESYRKLNSMIRRKKGEVLESISKNLAERYQYNEKKVLVDSKVDNLQASLDIIQDQINFYVETIKTVDNALFGLKTRVDLEKILE